MHERDLLGLWSVDGRYGPGAEEDTVALFRPDHCGYYAWETPTVTEGCVFRWRLEDDRLTTFAIREFASNPNAGPEKVNLADGLSWRLDRRTVAIGEEPTAAGTKTVLRLIPATSNWDLFAKLDVHPTPRYMVDAIKRFT